MPTALGTSANACAGRWGERVCGGGERACAGGDKARGA